MMQPPIPSPFTDHMYERVAALSLNIKRTNGENAKEMTDCKDSHSHDYTSGPV